MLSLVRSRAVSALAQNAKFLQPAMRLSSKVQETDEQLDAKWEAYFKKYHSIDQFFKTLANLLQIWNLKIEHWRMGGAQGHQRHARYGLFPRAEDCYRCFGGM